MASLIVLFIQAKLPRDFGLVPNKMLIIITQGQNQSIICQARQEAFPFDLTWEKQTSPGSYVNVNPSMVKRDQSNKMVREILTIANAKLSDSGIYKCTVSVKHKSSFRLTSVDVSGKLLNFKGFILLCHVKKLHCPDRSVRALAVLYAMI